MITIIIIWPEWKHKDSNVTKTTFVLLATDAAILMGIATITSTVESPNKGHFGNNINSAILHCHSPL